MRKIKETLRLSSLGLGARAIARATGSGRTSVKKYISAAKRAGLSWEEARLLSDIEIESRLCPVEPKEPGRPRPDWLRVNRELRCKGVTRQILWEEYVAEHPEGYSYSRYCELLAEWRGQVDLVMRQQHLAGEKLFVDYAGMTVMVFDEDLGKERPAQIFVAAMGASSYTFADCSWSQDGGDWIDSHVRCFEYLGGVPELTVPDNLKSGVTRACRWDPDINRAYLEMADHYDTAVIPARAGRPQDKAKVENAVLVAERWILARLRNRRFIGLSELRVAIMSLLEELNSRPFQKLPGCRKEAFEAIDAPALRPLPTRRFETSKWLTERVLPDYHVEADCHHYSVPHELVGKVVEIRLTRRVVEVLYGGKRVCSHRRSTEINGTTTLPEHMPKSHRAFADWTPKKLRDWAHEQGPEVGDWVDRVMSSRRHVAIGFRACRGLVGLAKRFGTKRLGHACAKASAAGSLRYGSIQHMLEKGLESFEVEEITAPSIVHDNVRGGDYYGADRC